MAEAILETAVTSAMMPSHRLMKRLHSWEMLSHFAKMDERLLVLVTSEVERVLEHFRGGAGGDGIEQATGAASMEATKVGRSGAGVSTASIMESPAWFAVEVVLVTASSVLSSTVAGGGSGQGCEWVSLLATQATLCLLWLAFRF